MATYGELRLVLSKWAPGIDLELIDGWFQDRYVSILDKLDWTRLQGQSAIVINATYDTGTITATNASTAITGSGTTWTAAMSNRLIRINAESQFYQFTYVSATTGTLDRAYQEDTASGLSYRIDQNVFQLPSDVRILDSVRLMEPGRDLIRATIGQLDTWDSNRQSYGAPTHYAIHMDANTDPPVMQIELYGTPEEATTALIWYTYDAAPPSATSTSLLPWMRPSAIKAGVQADICAHQKDWNGMAAFEALFEKYVNDMKVNEYRQIGAQPIRMDASMYAHRTKRWIR